MIFGGWYYSAKICSEICGTLEYSTVEVGFLFEYRSFENCGVIETSSLEMRAATPV